jgi:hypothetical protein
MLEFTFSRQAPTPLLQNCDCGPMKVRFLVSDLFFHKCWEFIFIYFWHKCIMLRMHLHVSLAYMHHICPIGIWYVCAEYAYGCWISWFHTSQKWSNLSPATADDQRRATTSRADSVPADLMMILVAVSRGGDGWACWGLKLLLLCERRCIRVHLTNYEALIY